MDGKRLTVNSCLVIFRSDRERSTDLIFGPFKVLPSNPFINSQDLYMDEKKNGIHRVLTLNYKILNEKKNWFTIFITIGVHKL